MLLHKRACGRELFLRRDCKNPLGHPMGDSVAIHRTKFCGNNWARNPTHNFLRDTAEKKPRKPFSSVRRHYYEISRELFGRRIINMAGSPTSMRDSCGISDR